MKISIIVCAYNEEKNITPCLTSLLDQRGVARDDYEIIIVDNKSTDRTGEICKELITKQKGMLPFLRYIQIEHLGLSIGRNTGLLRAQASLIAYIDADAIADPYWVSELLKAWKLNPYMDAMGGRIKVRNASEKIAWYLYKFYYQKIFEGSIIGANMSFRKEKLLEVGAFGDPLIGRGDEVVLLKKMGKRRKDFFCSEAVVFHDCPSSIHQWLHERVHNGHGLVFENRLLGLSSSRLCFSLFKRVFVIFVPVVFLFVKWQAVFIVVFAMLTRWSWKTFRSIRGQKSCGDNGKFCMAVQTFGWQVLSDIGVLMYLKGLAVSFFRFPSKEQKETVWNGAVSDDFVIKELCS